jgi:hypothetical protein
MSALLSMIFIIRTRTTLLKRHDMNVYLVGWLLLSYWCSQCHWDDCTPNEPSLSLPLSLCVDVFHMETLTLTLI